VILTPLDWVVIALYFALSLVLTAWVLRRADAPEVECELW